MAKLQCISWATICLILGLTAVDVSYAATKPLLIAQDSDQEMLDALQERQKTIDGEIDKIRKLTGTESQQEQEPEPDLSPEEMIDALKNRQQEIKELEELKQLEELTKNEDMLERLQAENFNVESLEDLEAIKTIVDDRDLTKEEMLNTLQQQNFNVQDLKKLKQLSKIVGKKRSYIAEDVGISGDMAFKLLTVGIPGTILIFLIGTPIVKGIVGTFTSNYQEKFGKPKVPEGSVNLHARSFKEITLIGNKAEKINNQKFGNEEFLLLLRIKINMAKEAEGYQGLSNCVDLLQAGIIAQKSFLRLEQTELRYRSRKQQEFYRYVAENLEAEIDREAFVKLLKKKKTEILPLVTTEEGREALDTYTKELTILSKYELGLKLLALFKHYELQDFSILKNVADIVEGLEGKDLIESKDLVSPVLEHYESFEKLGPIIGIAPEASTPQAYAKILQVIGLTNRHGKSYLEFEQLVKLLKKWEKPYKAIALVREEYTEDKYSIPAEFKEDIPGFNTHNKYEEYLPDL
ncbi:MAG: hypothetical protein AAF652_13460 [Cyanobacteria bacterium P01_C01_bin.72]